MSATGKSNRGKSSRDSRSFACGRSFKSAAVTVFRLAVRNVDFIVAPRTGSCAKMPLWEMTMTLTVPLSPEAEARLLSKARAIGLDLGTYAARLLERDAARSTLEEISGDLAERFKQTGMTEEELGELLGREKHEARERELGIKFSE